MIRFEPDVVGGAAALDKARAEGRTAHEVITRAAVALVRDRHQRTKGAVLDPPEWREVIASAKERGLLIEKADETDDPHEIEIATPIGLLTLRKMPPPLEVPTLVGPFYKHEAGFAKLRDEFSVERMLASSHLQVPTRRDVDLAAEAEGEALGIAFQGVDARGAMFVMMSLRDGTKRRVERRHLYAIVDQENVLAAARVFVRRIHADLGPGRVWTCGGRVAPMVDDGLAVAIEREGRTLLVLRSIFAHEHGPEVT